MKIFYILILFISIFSTNIKATEWTNADITREAIFFTVLYEDWRTTKKLLPYGREKNPLIGPYPTRREIDVIVLSVVIGHLYIVDKLSPKYREYFQYITIIGDGIAVYNNHKFMIQLNF